jgi:nitrite reductase/ring-hydroxylating ferredoxin subunit/uncharacterized membrane protein
VQEVGVRWSRLVTKLEDAEALDRAVDVVSRGVNSVLPPGEVKDALHGRWLRHPLHPALIALPIGTFLSVSLLDVTTDDQGSRDAARRLVGAGVLSVAPTAAAGLADWSALGGFDRAKRTGLVHAISNITATLLYSVSWWARRRGAHTRGRNLAFAGAAALTVGGYLGGHLSYVQAVGVDHSGQRPTGPTEWTDVAADDVQEGELRRVEVSGTPVLLARVDGALHGIVATCSHLAGHLHQGELRGTCVVCPLHGSHFRMRDGSVRHGPATAPLQAYDVRTVGDRIQVRLAG